MPVDVDSLLKKATPNSRELANALRKVVGRALPESQEIVKWGNPTYVVSEANVCWILVYHNHVDLGFFQGARMKSKRLEGTGKGLRHIKVRSVGDIDEKEFSRLLKEAAMLSVKGGSPVNK